VATEDLDAEEVVTAVATVVAAEVTVVEEAAVVVAEEAWVAVVDNKRNGLHPPNWEDWSKLEKLLTSKKSSDLLSPSKSPRLLIT
jgi:hypothetical protein